MTGQTKNANGTVAAPSVTFGSDLDSGFYRRAANSIGVALGGVDYMEFSTASVSIGPALAVSVVRSTGDITAGGQLLAADGSSASAAIAFATAHNIGFYKRTGVTSINLLIGDKDTIEFATASASIGQAVAVGALRSVAGVTAATAVTGATAAGAMVATQAEQETGTATDKLVTPGRQQFHASACKAWVNFNGGTGASNASYNATVTRNAAGDYTVNITVPFSTANYCSQVTCGSIGGAAVAIASLNRSAAGAAVAASAGAQRFSTFNVFGGGAAVDPDQVCWAAFGDQ